MGPGPWTSWLAPSVVQDPGAPVEAFTRFNAPGNTDPNHLDGIGALFLVAHLSIPTVGSAGILDLRDAEFEITIRGTDFQANGGKLMVWVCRYIPEEGIIRNYYVGLQVTNWANTGNDLASQLTDEWQTLTVQLSDDPEDWTYAGNAVSSQGDWGDRYQPLDLGQSLERVDATLHLVFVSDEPDEHPTGFLDIANITVRTQTPATPVGMSGADVDIFYGLEDQDAGGTLTLPAEINPAGAQFSVVSGSARNGSVTIDPDTGAFVFTPNANYYGPTDFVGAATFQYTVSDGFTTSAPRAVVVFVGPINDAPSASTADVLMEAAHDQPFAYTVFKASDVDEERLTFHVVDGSSLHGTVVMDEETGRYVFTPDAGYTGVAEFQYFVSDGQLDSAPATITINFHAAGDNPVLPTFNDVVDDYLLMGDIAGWRRYVVLLADEGDTNAAYHYGTWLHFGQGVTRDTALSAQYLALAAATVPDAALQLADMYVSGDGVPKDYVIARALLETLPTNKTAIYRLAVLDDLGFGAPQDHARAVEGFLEAAKLGHADAMYTLGRRYLMAEGVAFSAEDAYFWLGVALKYDAGPPFAPTVTQFDDLLRLNQQQAVDQAGLTLQQIADLDALIAAWTIGDPSPVNQAPEAGDETPASGDAGMPLQGQLATAEDSDGDHLTYLLVPGSEQNGTVTLDPLSGEWEFTPNPGYSGPASFQYVVSDGESQSAPSTVTLEFAPVTDAVNDTTQLDEAATLAVNAAAGLLANDAVSPEGTPLEVTAVNGQVADVGQPVAGTYGSITINADGSYTYVANASTAALLQGQTYVETFTYTVTDQEGEIDTATLQITINGVSGTVLSGNGVLIGSALDDVITGGAGHDTLLGQGGNDRLIGGAGTPDELYGGTGDDTFVVSNSGDSIIENSGEGTDTVETALSSFTQRNNVENLTYTGSGNFVGIGNGLNNVITGGVGADVLSGLAGNDTLIGGTGAANTLIGGLGDDVFVVSVAGDSYVENAGEGIDTVRTGLSSLTLRVHVENLVYTGSSNFTGTGNASNNAITGGAGNDTLNGLTGDDTMTGGLGDDLYYVDSESDEVVELNGEGTDTVRSTAAAYTLDNHVENAILWNGTAGVLIGNALNNSLTGGTGDDVLFGGAGADIMTGGLGNDLYFVDDLGDQVIDTGGNDDAVQVLVSGYTLAAGIERATLGAVAGALHVIGNDLDNSIAGNGDDNHLEGGAGNDLLYGFAGTNTLEGGTGDDLYYIHSSTDVLIENDGEGYDMISIQAGVAAFTMADHIELMVAYSGEDFTGTGNAAANEIRSSEGEDVLYGLGGNDILDGGAGDDTLHGGTGDDTLHVDSADDVVVELDGEGTDTVVTTLSAYTLGDFLENLTGSGVGAALTGNALNNVITGGSGNDTLNGAAGADTMKGGGGDDTYLVDDAGDVTDETGGWGTDTVETALAAYTLGADIENLTYTGSAAFAGTGNGLANSITGGDGNDTLDGGENGDTLTGGLGDDTYIVDDAGDVVLELDGEGTDTVRTALGSYTLADHIETLVYTGTGDFAAAGNARNNSITGGDGNDLLDGGDGDDVLDGGEGNDVLTGGLGEDSLTGGEGADTLNGSEGDDTLTGGLGDDLYLVDSLDDVVVEVDGEGDDTVRTTLTTYTLADHVERLAADASISGVDFTGNALNNEITGTDGNDVLDGGEGDDVLIGGLGDDTYYVDSATDLTLEEENEGTDTVHVTLTTYVLGADLENLTYDGHDDFEGYGNELNNEITGCSGDDVLRGLDGDDTLVGEEGANFLIGGLGDDIYVVSSADDIVYEEEDEGEDTVRTDLDAFTLHPYVEALVYTGSGDFEGTGNFSDNTIIGGAGEDVLDGMAGADTLIGGLGDDVYVVDDANDVIVEGAGEGTDEVRTSLTAYILGDDLENLTYVGAGDAELTGNDGANVITGDIGDDTIDGGLGADTMVGGDGDDVYIVEDVNDEVVEGSFGGLDEVRTALSTYTLGDHVDDLTYTGTGAFDGTGNEEDNYLTGGAGDDTLRGMDGDDWLNGGEGADTLVGGEGRDLYTVDNLGDVVTEAGTDGAVDEVETTLSTYTLGAGLEDLTFIGTGAFTGTGNDLDNYIWGSEDGANTLSGLDGDDTLFGGDEADDLDGGDGDDLLTGGAGNDSLDGGAGDDLLTGDAGDDVMTGGTGNDLYAVLDEGDIVNEAEDEGIDGIQTILTSYTLGDHVEALFYFGTDNFTGVGNDLDNLISGDEGDDVLTGGGGDDLLGGGLGDDTMTGGVGDDIYLVEDAGDVVVELASEGVDEVMTSLALYFLGDHVENLTFVGPEEPGVRRTGIGNALNNVLTGHDGGDILSGGGGDDTMIGGLGDDTYSIMQAGDVVVELGGEGQDSIYIEGAVATYTLADNVENLYVAAFLGGGAGFTLTGNALNNYIQGFATTNDVFDGGLGADRMAGSLGDDLYYIDNAGDIAEEYNGGGHDTVRTTLNTQTLHDWVEDMEFIGTGAFVGTGNVLANRITGGTGADTIDGGDGDDILIGRGGVDVLTGGAGIDTVNYASAAAGVVVRLDLGRATNDGDGATDTLNGFENVTGSAFNDTLFGNALGNTLTGGAGTDTLLGLAGNDVLIGGDGAANQLQGGQGDDRYVVTANDSIVELAGEGTDTVETNRATFTLAANLENLTYTGSAAFTGTGNGEANVITGGVMNDILSGGAGADTLNGGDGDDTLKGGSGVDVLAGGAGIDTVDYSAAAAGATVRLDLQRATNDGDGGTDTYSGIENALGSAFNDTLFGSSGANTLTGGAGTDTLLGLGGNDTLIGGSGAANQLQGGQGDDLYIVAAADTIVELTGEGHDTVQTTQNSYALSANVEDLTFTGSGAFFGVGSAVANVIRGGASADQLEGRDGDDTLWGGGSPDTLLGGNGVDTLYGEAGNDILNGGAGDDILTGGLGNDRYVVDSVGDYIVEVAGEGTDTVETTLNVYALGADLENLTFTGTGAFIGTGNDANNVITGGVGNDLFIAGLGNDTFNGGAGIDTVDYGAVGSAVVVKLNGSVATNDGQGGIDTLVGVENVIGTAYDDTLIGDGQANVLTGGGGRDTLIGGAGNDWLIGGAGLANTMQGGLGDDTYVVSVASDSVLEFTGEGTDTVRTDLAAYTLGSHLENLTYTGAGTFTGTGNTLANTITGGGLDDVLRGGAGNDTLRGEGGDDIAVLSGLQGSYTIIATAQGYQITDNAAGVDGDDGVDQLIGVERVRFKDGTTITLADLGLTPAPVLSAKEAAATGEDPLVQPSSAPVLEGEPEVQPAVSPAKETVEEPLILPSAAPAVDGEPEVQPLAASSKADAEEPLVQPVADLSDEPLVLPPSDDVALTVKEVADLPLVLPGADDFMPTFADDGRLVQPGVAPDDLLLSDRPTGHVLLLADDPLVIQGPHGPVVLLPDDIVGAHRSSDDGL